MKVKQLALFPVIEKSVVKRDLFCCICKRPIRRGVIGDGCYRRILKQIEQHKQAIDYYKENICSTENGA